MFELQQSPVCVHVSPVFAHCRSEWAPAIVEAATTAIIAFVQRIIARGMTRRTRGDGRIVDGHAAGTPFLQ